MDIFTLSYLVRYIPIALFAGLVALLLKDSLKELRWDLDKNVHPLSGFGLFWKNPAADKAADTKATNKTFALFHTTLMGSSSTCDIFMKGKGIGKKHAIIYFYDGDWFIRSFSPKYKVKLNGVEIHHPTPLENKDTIIVGNASFRFLSEHESDSYILKEDEIILYPKRMKGIKNFFSLLFVIAFSVFTGLLLILFVPAEYNFTRETIALFYGIFLFLGVIYYLVLPLIFERMDKILLLILLQLSAIGFLIQIRLEILPGVMTTKTPDELILNLTSQAISYFAAFIFVPILAIIVAKTYFLERIWIICAVLTPLLLLITFVLGSGEEEHGAGLWIKIGSMSFQLTEMAKITYLIVLAAFFKNRATKKSQLIFAAWAAFIFGMILLLPDLGLAMILLPTTLLIYVVMTSEYITAAFILGIGSIMSVLAYSLFDHVRRRIDGWSLLWTEINDNNRQIVYGLQAIGRGGFLGRGVGNGNPGGIPLASSDMVFSIVCEELGLIAGFCLVLLFIILWLRSAKIAVLSVDGYSSSLALGIGTLFFIQAAVVISGTTGLLPLTGATVPLIARGGSSVMSILFLFGILLGLSGRKGKVFE